MCLRYIQTNTWNSYYRSTWDIYKQTHKTVTTDVLEIYTNKLIKQYYRCTWDTYKQTHQTVTTDLLEIYTNKHKPVLQMCLR